MTAMHENHEREAVIASADRVKTIDHHDTPERVCHSYAYATHFD
ncbi:hypothetical protein K239x_26370 [Planctomycetes bacterium K23_9]|uniref:Uncharacterized protein n=2 Tax=Stieleria marina TaxID=1930275 RepID=A0A517NU88_9BACT|nr:hypothetical protein K239x_26370 [Planctomycetes bacterium K23_9]